MSQKLFRFFVSWFQIKYVTKDLGTIPCLSFTSIMILQYFPPYPAAIHCKLWWTALKYPILAAAHACFASFVICYPSNIHFRAGCNVHFLGGWNTRDYGNFSLVIWILWRA